MTTAQDRARLIVLIKERSFEKGGERKLASGRTSNPRTVCPALTRFNAIGAPIEPRPMNAMRMTRPFYSLTEPVMPDT